MASYVAPNLRTKFESLSIDLKNTVLKRDVQLNNIYDLIEVLEQIVDESSTPSFKSKFSDHFV